MICEVNGEPTPAHWISSREPGFGQPVELPLYPYWLRYNLAEMRDLIAEDANVFIQEMKRDHEQTGDTHPQYLHDLGYPPIDTLVQHENEFCELVGTFLYSELFDRSFPKSPLCRDVRWIINSVDAVLCHSGNVEVLGRAFRMVEPKRPR